MEKQERMKAELIYKKLNAEKVELEEALAKGSTYVKDMDTKVRKVETEKKEIDRQVSICNISRFGFLNFLSENLSIFSCESP